MNRGLFTLLARFMEATSDEKHRLAAFREYCDSKTSHAMNVLSAATQSVLNIPEDITLEEVDDALVDQLVDDALNENHILADSPIHVSDDVVVTAGDFIRSQILATIQDGVSIDGGSLPDDYASIHAQSLSGVSVVIDPNDAINTFKDDIKSVLGLSAACLAMAQDNAADRLTVFRDSIQNVFQDAYNSASNTVVMYSELIKNANSVGDFFAGVRALLGFSSSVDSDFDFRNGPLYNITGATPATVLAGNVSAFNGGVQGVMSVVGGAIKSAVSFVGGILSALFGKANDAIAEISNPTSWRNSGPGDQPVFNGIGYISPALLMSDVPYSDELFPEGQDQMWTQWKFGWGNIFIKYVRGNSGTSARMFFQPKPISMTYFGQLLKAFIPSNPDYEDEPFLTYNKGEQLTPLPHQHCTWTIHMQPDWFTVDHLYGLAPSYADDSFAGRNEAGFVAGLYCSWFIFKVLGIAMGWAAQDSPSGVTESFDWPWFWAPNYGYANTDITTSWLDKCTSNFSNLDLLRLVSTLTSTTDNNPAPLIPSLAFETSTSGSTFSAGNPVDISDTDSFMYVVPVQHYLRRYNPQGYPFVPYVTTSRYPEYGKYEIATDDQEALGVTIATIFAVIAVTSLVFLAGRITFKAATAKLVRSKQASMFKYVRDFEQGLASDDPDISARAWRRYARYKRRLSRAGLIMGGLQSTSALAETAASGLSSAAEALAPSVNAITPAIASKISDSTADLSGFVSNSVAALLIK